MTRRALPLLSPAKLNLFLAVTGRRADGFHDLVSVVAPLGWGDDLSGAASNAPSSILTCDDALVPTGLDNLVLKAAAAYAAAVPTAPKMAFHLGKRIPMGAGLGGGSSNAAAALQLLQDAAPDPLPAPELTALAAGIGSDCPLFLHPRPVAMRGRGEHVSALPAAALRRIQGRRVYVFKPAFGIPTPWAYRQLAAGAPGSYLAPELAEARLAEWIASELPLENLLFNSLEAPAFAKFPGLPAVIELVQERFGLPVLMTGSGSALFALLPPEGGPSAADLHHLVQSALGPSTFGVESYLAGQRETDLTPS